MKTLFVKDLQIITKYKTFLIIMLCVIVLSGTSLELFNDSASMISFIVIMMSMVGLGTLSYDVYGNGMSFLMTLPVSRKEYAIEKHLFIVGIMAVGYLLAAGFSYGKTYIQQGGITAEDILGGITAFWLLAGIIQIMIPIRIKFGESKGKMVMLILMVLIFAVVNFVPLPKLVTKMEGIPEVAFLVGSVVGFLLSFGVSTFFSVSIMEKKEF